jgi:hypothetical protein
LAYHFHGVRASAQDGGGGNREAREPGLAIAPAAASLDGMRLVERKGQGFFVWSI